MNFVSSITPAFKDAFSSGFTSAQNSMAGMKSALGGLNQNRSMNRLAADLSMAAGMTEPFRQSLNAALDRQSKLAGAFDSSMRNIQSLTNESDESLARLGKTLLSVGGTSVAGPNAIADAYYNITSGIGDATVRLDALRAAVKLAESGQADLGAAATGLIGIINAYGTSAENISGLSDVFFQTLNKGKGEPGGFVTALSSVSGLSASMGIEFAELGSAMSVISKTQEEAVAATQLKAVMVALMKPPAELAQALKTLGYESGSAMVKENGLAASLNLLKQAMGGSDDKMAKALSSSEALQAALALTTDTYGAFAKE